MDQNFSEFVKTCGRTQSDLYREFNRMARTRGIKQVSDTQFRKWCKMDLDTKNKEWLSILTELTGIATDKLFEYHD